MSYSKISVALRLPILGQLTRRSRLKRLGWDRGISQGEQGQVIGQVPDPHILEFKSHGWALVGLQGKHSIECPTLYMKINQISGRVTVDPVAVPVSFNQNPILMPLSGGETNPMLSQQISRYLDRLTRKQH